MITITISDEQRAKWIEQYEQEHGAGSSGLRFEVEPVACARCDGAGGSSEWPGWTCYRCDGRKVDPRRVKYVISGSPTRQYLDFIKRSVEQERERAKKRSEGKCRKRQEDAVHEAGNASEFIRDNGLEFLEDENAVAEVRSTFISSIRRRLFKDGHLTARQVEAVKGAWERERLSEQEANVVPEGRATVTGVVIKTDVRSGVRFERAVMTVKVDEGFVAWGTIPSAILPTGALDDLHGKRVRFSARFEPADDDPGFAFYSRPTKAEVL